MNQSIGSSFSLGILGAGQLGKMLAQAASPWDLRLRMLDPSPQAPAAHLCETFVRGDFRDYQTVLDFGKTCDVLTIEIEQVNAEALTELEAEGVNVYPQPSVLKIIQDKGLQKQFLVEKNLPTSAFTLYDGPEAVRAAAPPLPCVQKTRTEGYDGRGVKMLRKPEDFDTLLPGPCLVEDAVEIHTELAVIAARSPSGEIKTYDPVEMSFHPEANLVEFLAAPARISPEQASEARALAEATIDAFGLVGLLAVEMFLDTSGNLLINEVAPRPHNSGHHTIEACVTSQYQQHLRAILDLPLGDTRLRAPAVMLNVLGADGFSGPVIYEGVEHVLSTSSAFLHLYGKTETRPFRKMGHMTVLGDSLEEAIAKARALQPLLKVKA
ncbi:MAG: 5-(carboxyamino)imidazole ribonucleotide synthase [Verrucomicrobia bacterium]|nr:5-(carboxyamino)imidazole ribonucleotide synthase [Verrucomicrobiota bacterium]MCH8526806.1 5-(carboxyamino)imidazole ribonucleotide synthase [Kiritimatiellia bacterium]